MPDITLDGESVHFDGPAPAALPALLAAVEQSLASAGRILAAVKVDGRETVGELSAEDYQAARCVELHSMTVEAATQHLAASCRARAAELEHEVSGVATAVLCEPWPEVVPKLVAVAERLAGLMNDLGALGMVPGLGPCAEALGAALQRWMDTIGAHDAARASLELDQAVLPILHRLAAEGGGESGDPA